MTLTNLVDPFPNSLWVIVMSYVARCLCWMSVAVKGANLSAIMEIERA